MEQSTTILEGYSDEEKGAYLGAIASMATADRSASEEELSYIKALCASADLPEDETGSIIQAASSQMSDADLKSRLDVLRNSELKYSLVSDVIAFAESDKNYSVEEKQNVEKMARYLGVNAEQVSVLHQFTQTAVEEAPKHADAIEAEQTTPHGFLESLGFGDKLKSAGINSSSIFKTALGIIGPMLLAKMFSKGRSSNSNAGGGLLGGLGGLLGGSGGGLMQSGGNGGGLLGGLGSLLGGNSGGLLGGLLGGSSGGGSGSLGGLLGRVLGGRS